MIEAKYSDGSVYRCDSFWQIDFRKFVVHGLTSLAAGNFQYDRLLHGTPRYHGLRTVVFGASRNQRKIYVLVTDLFKIFVFDTGVFELHTDWIKDHPIYSEMRPKAPLLAGDEPAVTI